VSRRCAVLRLCVALRCGARCDAAACCGGVLRRVAAWCDCSVLRHRAACCAVLRRCDLSPVRLAPRCGTLRRRFLLRHVTATQALLRRVGASRVHLLRHVAAPYCGTTGVAACRGTCVEAQVPPVRPDSQQHRKGAGEERWSIWRGAMEHLRALERSDGASEAAGI
jgi:hypothetical protein